MRATALVSAVLTIANALSLPRHKRGDGLNLSTTSGQVHGKIDDTYPNVRQFLGIPYAQPPLGDLRWAAPRPLVQPYAQIEATQLPLSCMQLTEPTGPTIYSEEVPEFGIEGDVSEDCLSLSVYAPTLNSSSEEALPVIIWFYGGGWQGGGQNSQIQRPMQWITRDQDHLIVTFNYRTNIFGFTGGVEGLNDWNLGYLDQRLAVEWTRDNIAAFGGDASRMIVWGQSAGAGSIDAYTHAYPDDPIVTGAIQDSNPPIVAVIGDRTGTNFSYVATELGCTGEDQLACMRKLPAKDIEDFVGSTWSSVGPTLFFYPTIDDKVVFANNTERALAGKVANIPTIFGTNRDEGVGNIPYDPNGINETLAHQTLLAGFFCPVTDIIKTRQEIGLLTYRFIYSGNFSNVSPQPWMGAYHGAELSIIFGTHPDFRENSTQLEYETSLAMQDAWVAFARDSVNGLDGEGWKAYEQLGESTVREFGAGVAARDISIAETEGECPL